MGARMVVPELVTSTAWYEAVTRDDEDDDRR
jgi:hypothetical protein